jgi:hypothetical protein
MLRGCRERQAFAASDDMGWNVSDAASSKLEPSQSDRCSGLAGLGTEDTEGVRIIHTPNYERFTK